MPDNRTTFIVPHRHPAFAGHFPGHPILPGVVLLDYLRHWLLACQPEPMSEFHLIQAKFLRPVLPGNLLTVSLHTNDQRRYRLQAHVGEHLVAHAEFRHALAADASA